MAIVIDKNKFRKNFLANMADMKLVRTIKESFGI